MMSLFLPEEKGGALDEAFISGAAERLHEGARPPCLTTLVDAAVPRVPAPLRPCVKSPQSRLSLPPHRQSEQAWPRRPAAAS